MSSPIRLGAYAKLRGVTAEAVRQAVIKGRLKHSVVMVKDKPWIGDVVLANREWDLNTASKHTPKHLLDPMSLGSLATAPARAAVNRQAKSMAAAPTEDNRHRPADIDPDAFDSPEAIDPATGVPKVSVSRARKEHFDAMQAQTKAEQLAGTLINREEVTRAAFSVAREVRDALLQIKDRLADELATMTDANQISKHLDTEFRHALAKLSGEIAIDGPDVG